MENRRVAGAFSEHMKGQIRSLTEGVTDGQPLHELTMM